MWGTEVIASMKLHACGRFKWRIVKATTIVGPSTVPLVWAKHVFAGFALGSGHRALYAQVWIPNQIVATPL